MVICVMADHRLYNNKTLKLSKIKETEILCLCFLGSLRNVDRQSFLKVFFISFLFA